MKIHELARVAKPPSAGAEAEQDDLYEEEEEEDETQANLTEALLQLENCWALLDALDDHFTVPKAKITKFLKREISKAANDSCNLLLQYNMAEINPATSIIDLNTSSCNLTGEE